MTELDEFAYMDATGQAELVRNRKVTPLELVDAAIVRIERVNPHLNAVVTPMYEEARETASGRLRPGPFSGVPFLLKDLVATYRGVRMTSGSQFLCDYIPDHDSELVKRLKNAGLIVLGKTNTCEFGTLPTTEPRLLGPCRNPWDTARTSGGSSGGAAAAVAAGMVSMAHGNDGGGSVRIPASCCGVFGMKPTRGRNPLGPDFGDVWGGLVVEHAITRSVRDSAALLDATAGPDVGDPYWAPPPRRPYVEEMSASPGRLRIAFSTAALSGVTIHPDCIAAAEDAAAVCEDLGHDVEVAVPTVDAELMAQTSMTLFTSSVAWMIGYMARITSRPPAADLFEPLTWALYELGCHQSSTDWLLAVTDMQRISRDMALFFEKYDVWLTPTLGEPPVPLGTFDSPPDNPLLGIMRCGSFAAFTSVWNSTGQPAMSVPLFWNRAGLPIGTHFVGRFGDEATLFRLAAQLEKARPWAMRRPPLPD